MNRANRMPLGPISALSLTIAMCQQTVIAAENPSNAVLEEITVTAQRRSESLQDVPIAITALSADQLGKGDIQQLGDIMKLTPGLRFDNQGGNAQPTIRGVGSSVVMAGAGANIALYTDGFYSPNPLMGDSELLNIDSIQVLKGPQGTLFGRNSTGGAILVTTKDPSPEEAVKLAASYGNYNTQRYSLYTTAGTEKLAFDAAALVRQGDGYLDNIITGKDNDGEFRNWSLRLGALWNVSDSTTLLFRFTKSEVDDPSTTSVNFFEDNGQVYSYAGTLGAKVSSKAHEIANTHPFEYESESKSYQLRLTTDLGFATLTSYTQYRDEIGTHRYDFDASPLDIYNYYFETADEIFTQEVIVSSTGSGPIQWTTGLFYMEDETHYPNNQASVAGSEYFPFGGTGIETTSIAAYVDLTYALTNNWFLTLGARYSSETLEDAFYIDLLRNVIPVDDVDESKITPRIALRYELSDNSSVYASYAEGYKASMINLAGGDLLGTYLTSLSVDPEEINAYEIGYKYQGGNLTFDLAAFYYDYKDLQQISYLGADTIVNNAANSSVLGVEFQTRYALSEHLEVNLGVAWLDAQYDDYDDSQAWSQCLSTACGSSFGLYLPIYVDGSGNQMQRSPELTATLGASYNLQVSEGILEFSGTLYHTSDFYFDTSEAYQQDSYQLLSLRVEWTDPSETYSVAIFGDNLTDEDYVNSLLPQFYGALATWGAPRTYGASIAFNF